MAIDVIGDPTNTGIKHVKGYNIIFPASPNMILQLLWPYGEVDVSLGGGGVA